MDWKSRRVTALLEAALIEDKKRLSSLVVGTDESWLTELDNDTFKELIALRHSAVLE